MNAKKSTNAVAARNAWILFIFPLRSKKKKEKALIKEEIFLINPGQDCGRS
jgi:hypothetical protein